MDKNEEYGALVAFTTLAPLAVGGLVGLLVALPLQRAPKIDESAIVVFATGVLALLASMLHLGRPWRAPLALLQLKTSWLSREVLFFTLFLLAVACYAILPVLSSGILVSFLVGTAGAIIGLIGTVITGETYRLRSRPAWDRRLSVASFPLGALSTGSLFGFFVAQLFTGHSPTTSAWAAAALFLLVSLVVSLLRLTRHRPESVEGRLGRQLVLGANLWLLVVREAALIISLVMITVGGEAQFLAWIPALLGELADRILFFKTVVPVTLRGRYIDAVTQMPGLKVR